MVTIAAILARGLGTRMRHKEAATPLDPAQEAVAATGAKGMIPFGRPFLDYSLSALADAGMHEVVLVVAPGPNAIRSHYDAHPPERLRLRFAEQPEPLGTANAVLSAARVVGDAAFLVLNADNLYPVEVLRALAAVDSAAVAAFDRETLVRESNIEPERISRFALLSVNERGLLEGVVEKPEPDDAPAGAAWVGMNAWVVTAPIVAACEAVPRSVRGEFELPEAVALAIAAGTDVRAVPVRAGVLDLSSQRDIAAVAARLEGVVARP